MAYNVEEIIKDYISYEQWFAKVYGADAPTENDFTALNTAKATLQQDMFSKLVTLILYAQQADYKFNQLRDFVESQEPDVSDYLSDPVYYSGKSRAVNDILGKMEELK